jgi:hypothetical protein
MKVAFSRFDVRFSPLIQFEDVGEDGDAGSIWEGSGSTVTEMRRHAKKPAPAFPG